MMGNLVMSMLSLTLDALHQGMMLEFESILKVGSGGLREELDD